MTYDTQTPIGDIALKTPESMRLFESLGLDYCCGGNLSLGTACEKADLDIQEVLAKLSDLDKGPMGSEEPATLAVGALTNLIDHIEARHHTFTRQELDRLGPLSIKVLHAHGERHPELTEIARLFQTLEADLRSHLMKEEQILFPYIRGLEGNGEACEACFGTVLGPISVMQREHEDAGAVLAHLKQLTRNYETPADGCASFRSLYLGLQALEEDLHRHIFLENHLLFPRAVEREKRGV